MRAEAVVLFVSVCMLQVSGSIYVSKRDVDLDPDIPRTLDFAFIKFQQTVAEKQKETPVVFSDFNAYKVAFDSFKSGGSEGNLLLSTPANVDSNFAKFQKFIVKYMRLYNNFDEFTLRYGLFVNVLQKMAGYNDGGDGLAGINHLADKTLKEKQGLYGHSDMQFY